MLKRSGIRNPTPVFGAILIVGIFSWAWAVLYHFNDADKIDHAVTALALLVGGGWTFYQFVLRRAFESALSIECTVRTEPLRYDQRDDKFVVFCDVLLQNIGPRRITAPQSLAPDQRTEFEQSVTYPADLQLKRLADGELAPQLAGWWSSTGVLESIPGVPEAVSLLYEYTKADGKIDFFMEPSEKYH